MARPNRTADFAGRQIPVCDQLVGAIAWRRTSVTPDPFRVAIAFVALQNAFLYTDGIRKDPVQIRVAIPAADPPDNV